MMLFNKCSIKQLIPQIGLPVQMPQFESISHIFFREKLIFVFYGFGMVRIDAVESLRGQRIFVAIGGGMEIVQEVGGYGVVRVNEANPSAACLLQPHVTGRTYAAIRLVYRMKAIVACGKCVAYGT